MTSFGQIELEHTYDNAYITRVNLEYSGEKYYEFKTATNELVMYNADHTLWKTILLPAPAPTKFTQTSLFHLSEARINPDNNLEIMFGYYGASGFECKVISEDGTEITILNNVQSVKWSEIPGLPAKLITTFYNGSYSSKVYSLPDFALEHSYSEGIVSRIALENSGEKYSILDKINGNIKLYDQYHSLWKTVALPKPTEAIYSDFNIVSETLINPDAVLEIGYTYYTYENNVTVYAGKVVNEMNVALITIPEAKSMFVDVIPNVENKLIVTINHDSPFNGLYASSNVYQLPSLVLENAYESEIARVNLENSGVKFYTSRNPMGSFAKIYNANHTIWKSIFLDIPFDSNAIDLTLNIISETKIASDPLLEIGYCYVYHSPLMYDEYYGQVMNENGLTYLNTSGTQAYVLSEFPDLPIKLIELINMPDVFENTSSYDSNVYSIDASMAANGFQKDSSITITPNPTHSIISITSAATIVEAKIYNMLGAEVKAMKAQNLTRINLENLPSGMYLIDLTDVNHQKSTHKIFVAD